MADELAQDSPRSLELSALPNSLKLCEIDLSTNWGSRVVRMGEGTY